MTTKHTSEEADGAGTQEWEKELDGARITRIGGIFNGENPVYFEQEQRLWEAIKPNIKNFIRSRLSRLHSQIVEEGRDRKLTPLMGRMTDMEAFNSGLDTYEEIVNQAFKDL